MGHPAVVESPSGDRASRTVRLRMVNIRQANLNDVPVLRTLIQEMADYERLPLLITKKEVLARDGFGSRQSSATRGLLWNYVPGAGLERNDDSVLQEDGCHLPGRLENGLPEGRCLADCRQCCARELRFCFCPCGAETLADRNDRRFLICAPSAAHPLCLRPARNAATRFSQRSCSTWTASGVAARNAERTSSRRGKRRVAFPVDRQEIRVLN